QGMFTYVPIDKPDSDPIVVIQQYTGPIPPTDACMLQPNYCVRNAGNQCTVGQYQTTCTNKLTNTLPIKICWNLGSQQECDYWNPRPHPPNFVFPLSGNVQFPNEVVSPASGTMRIAMQNPLRGGGCNVYIDDKQVVPLNPAYWTVNGNSIAW